MQTQAQAPWLLLIVSLPTSGATARMRIWRALKAQGCMALRDGAYLMPGNQSREQALQELVDECVREGGNAWLMTVHARTPAEDAAYQQLFDRTAEYAELRATLKESSRSL